jgi:hypothetical protein
MAGTIMRLIRAHGLGKMWSLAAAVATAMAAVADQPDWVSCELADHCSAAALDLLAANCHKAHGTASI